MGAVAVGVVRVLHRLGLGAGDGFGLGAEQPVVPIDSVNGGVGVVDVGEARDGVVGEIDPGG